MFNIHPFKVKTTHILSNKISEWKIFFDPFDTYTHMCVRKKMIIYGITPHHIVKMKISQGT
jgi:hypothetical protein